VKVNPGKTNKVAGLRPAVFDDAAMAATAQCRWL